MLRCVVALIMGFTAPGCGQPPTNFSNGIVVDDFKFYVESFRDQAEAHGRHIQSTHFKSLSMDFGDAKAACGNDYAIGCCSYKDGLKVTIDKEYWNRVAVPQRMALAYHELGHCLLGRDHLDHTDDKGHPVSVMSAHLIDGRFFAQKMTYFLDELFTR